MSSYFSLASARDTVRPIRVGRGPPQKPPKKKVIFYFLISILCLKIKTNKMFKFENQTWKTSDFKIVQI
jgi:hypothetical protein